MSIIVSYPNICCNPDPCTPIVPPTVDCPSCTSTCLSAPHIVISGEDSAGPCGDVVSSTISLTEASDCFCTGGFAFELEAYDPSFSSVTLDQSGELTFSFRDGLVSIGEPYDIVYKVSCLDPFRSSYGKIQILVRDMCSNVICLTNTTCNSCTGVCDPVEVNLSINIASNSSCEDSANMVLTTQLDNDQSKGANLAISIKTSDV